MLARVATFEDVRIEKADEVLEAIREHALPEVEELSGWSGVLTLVDTQRQRVLAIDFFEAPEDVQAAEPTFRELPERLPDVVRQVVEGARSSVEVFDVRMQVGVALGSGVGASR
jgi:hypothetical protein